MFFFFVVAVVVNVAFACERVPICSLWAIEMKMKTVKGAHHHLTIYNPLDARRRKTDDHFATRAKQYIQMRAHTRDCDAVSVCTHSAHVVHSSQVCFSLSIRCYFFGASVLSAEP